jgi:hypothetical protein
MSIIHDALRKVQAQSPVNETPAAADTSRHPLTIIIAVVLSFTILIIFGILYKLTVDTTRHGQAATSTPPARITAPQHPSSAPTAGPINSNDPRVEGVMDMSGTMRALINGNVYEEGQSFNGLTITKISFDTITVVENGAERKLPVKN